MICFDFFDLIFEIFQFFYDINGILFSVSCFNYQELILFISSKLSRIMCSAPSQSIFNILIFSGIFSIYSFKLTVLTSIIFPDLKTSSLSFSIDPAVDLTPISKGTFAIYRTYSTIYNRFFLKVIIFYILF